MGINTHVESPFRDSLPSLSMNTASKIWLGHFCPGETKVTYPRDSNGHTPMESLRGFSTQTILRPHPGSTYTCDHPQVAMFWGYHFMSHLVYERGMNTRTFYFLCLVRQREWTVINVTKSSFIIKLH